MPTFVSGLRPTMTPMDLITCPRCGRRASITYRGEGRGEERGGERRGGEMERGEEEG